MGPPVAEEGGIESSRSLVACFTDRSITFHHPTIRGEREGGEEGDQRGRVLPSSRDPGNQQQPIPVPPPAQRSKIFLVAVNAPDIAENHGGSC